MTEIIVRLTPAADTTLLQRAIQNMKGVFSATLRVKESENIDKSKLDRSNKIEQLKYALNHEEYKNVNTEQEDKEWITKIRDLSNSMDNSYIDYDDERTQYILSK